MAVEVRSLRTAELRNSARILFDPEAGVAVLVDPVRDVDQYLEMAAQESATLSWALETHVHNDFVSGADELVATSGARLGASGDAGPGYPYERLGDGDGDGDGIGVEIDVGSLRYASLRPRGTLPSMSPTCCSIRQVSPEPCSRAGRSWSAPRRAPTCSALRSPGASPTTWSAR